MLNLSVRGKKACLCGLALGLLAAGAAPVQAASLTTVTAFDLHYTNTGVVEGTGLNQGYLYGTIYNTSLSYGGAIYRVPLTGGEPETVYQFSPETDDGYSPRSTLLVSSDGNFYGTTYYGPRLGTSTVAGTGTIYRVAQDGSSFATLHEFTAVSAYSLVTGNAKNADGIYPTRALVEDDSYLYGVTALGGENGTGVVFSLRKADNLLTVLHAFAEVKSSGVSTEIDANGVGEGAFPSAALTLGTDGRLYGVTSGGGANLKTSSSGTTSGSGTIFSVNTDGSDFRTLYNFSELDDSADISDNGDGAQPAGRLVEVQPGIFVGTASDGGTPNETGVDGYGTIFEYNTGTEALTTLYAFDNDTGATPTGDLVLDDTSGLVYGIASVGSGTTDMASAYGNLFSIDPQTAEFTLVHPFTFAEGSSLTGALTIASNGDLYGTSTYGGLCTSYSAAGYGGVYRYSIGTNAEESDTYSNCTKSKSSSGSGSMSGGWLLLLAALGMAPPVRRRWLALSNRH